MGIATTLYAIGDAIDPRLSFWSVLLTTNKRLNEHQLIPTLRAGVKGLRKLDWGDDLVSTGDIKRVKEITLHCPDGRTAVLEIPESGTAFQFKTKSMNMLGAGDTGLEFQVIGRVLDKLSGACECFAWDYRPKAGEEHLVAYRSTIYQFGMWRDSCTPLGALGLDVHGFKL
jgi:hypothetical protein